MFAKLALRDLLFVAASLGLWWLIAGFSAGEGVVADLSGVVAGLLLAASAYVLHEWGHLLGAFAGRSVVHPPASLRSISLFSYDSQRNSKRQFVVMSLAGFAVTAAAVVAVYTALPEDQLATRVARGGVLFLTALTLFLEVPILVWALLAKQLPPVETFEPKGDEAEKAA